MIYEICPTPQGYKIFHRPLNALLPGVYTTREKADKALATVLDGGVLPGPGAFTFRGQPMTLCNNLYVEFLPTRPNLPKSSFRNTQHPMNHLAQARFKEGFLPIDNLLFDQVKVLESAWNDDSFSALGQATKDISLIWEMASALPLANLNIFQGVPKGDVAPLAKHLKKTYPELAGLTDALLCELFEYFTRNSSMPDNGKRDKRETVARDDNFIFFLLERLTVNYHTSWDFWSDLYTGKIIAFGLTRGDSIKASLALGHAWRQYDMALYSLARRIRDAMDYLAKR